MLAKLGQSQTKRKEFQNKCRTSQFVNSSHWKKNQVGLTIKGKPLWLSGRILLRFLNILICFNFFGVGGIKCETLPVAWYNVIHKHGSKRRYVWLFLFHNPAKLSFKKMILIMRVALRLTLIKIKNLHSSFWYLNNNDKENCNNKKTLILCWIL